jgi:hypothetical protein
LLAGLKCSDFRTGGTFGVHGEPDRPDKDASYARGDILHDLHVVLFRQGLDAGVVRLDFGLDHRAVADCIMLLDGRYRLSIAARASRKCSGGQNDDE